MPRQFRLTGIWRDLRASTSQRLHRAVQSLAFSGRVKQHSALLRVV